MRIYMVDFTMSADCGIVHHYATFYASDPCDLAEQIMDYEDDMDLCLIVLFKDIREMT